MHISRINRYITSEISVPMFIGLFVFTFVLLLGQILKLAEMVINKGVPLGEIAKLFALALPTFMIITVPLGFLLGVLIGFGRLSSDSEIVALRACGISLYRLMIPVMFCALITSLITAAFTLQIGPACKTAFRTQVFNIASIQASTAIQPRVFNDNFNNLVLYADNVDDRNLSMTGVFISDERAGNAPTVIVASKGRIISNEGAQTLTLRLNDGSLHRNPSSGVQESYQLINFKTYDISLNIGQEVPNESSRPKKPKELSTADLFELWNQSLSMEKPDKDTRKKLIELHRRFILPLAPIIFALIGVPLGIQSHRSGKGSGFTMALIVFLLFYMLQSIAETLAAGGKLPLAPLMWAPAVITFAGGFHLMNMTAREKRLFIFELMEDGLPGLRKRLRRGRS